MYAAIWRRLPGARLAKAAQCLVLVLAFVAFCFLWLFPTITPYLPFEDVTVEPSSETSDPGPVPTAPVSGTSSVQPRPGATS